MSGPRRRVRATPGFFHPLDQLLPAERTATAPSRADFEALDLLRAIDEFADRYDDLPPLIPGRPEYRILISTGRLVYAYTIVAQLARDGTVELVEIDLQLAPLDLGDPDEEPDEPDSG